MVDLNKVSFMSPSAFGNVVDTDDNTVYCVQGVAVPGTRRESIAFVPNPDAATIFTAPADGWVCLYAISNNTTWYIENTVSHLRKRGYWSTTAAFNFADYLRVAKGDVVAIYMNLGAVSECFFAYDK